MMSYPKRQVRTLHERLKIIEEVEKNPGEKRVHIAKRLGLSSSTLNAIIAKKSEIRQHVEKCGNSSKERKMRKESKYAELETILIAWYQQALISNIAVDGNILREKARIIAAQMNIGNFTASNGWITRFKYRHGLLCRKITKAAISESPVMDDNADLWLEELPALLEGYEPCDVYNAGETGLYLNILPDRTSDPNTNLNPKGESCPRKSNPKDRLTVFLCVNNDGSDKLQPILIGKTPGPECLSNIKELPITYYSNSKAWMTNVIFLTFLKSLDEIMEEQNKKILLFVNNSITYSQDTSFLRNVLVVYYPVHKNLIQPLDLGIIKSFKQFYKKRLVETTLYQIESDKTEQKQINILQAMQFIVSSWEQVTQKTIETSFKNAGHVTIKNQNNEKHDWEKLSEEVYEQLDTHQTTSSVDTVEKKEEEEEELCENHVETVLVKVEKEDYVSESESDVLPNFDETYEALMKVKSFFHKHRNNDSDIDNVSSLEKSFFELKRKMSTDNCFKEEVICKNEQF